jgi:hypothetical protein
MREQVRSPSFQHVGTREFKTVSVSAPRKVILNRIINLEKSGMKHAAKELRKQYNEQYG